MGHIFISYSKKDIPFARHLRRLLEGERFPVSIDEVVLDPGERWWREIEKNIDAADAVVVIMSPDSLASDWVERELLYAERRRKPIYPILLAGEPWSRLANIQYADMTAGVNSPLPPFLRDALKLVVTSDIGDLPSPSPKPPPPASARPPFNIRPVAAALIGVLAFLALIVLLPRLTPDPSPTATLAPTQPPGALPNLTVGRLRTSPRVPAPGQVFFFSIAISNVGTVPSGPFNWAWDASLTDPILLNSLSGRIDNIPPNGSKNISFPFSYGWWGTYNTQLVVDVDSEVTETDDRDNRRPFVLELGDVPFVVDFSLLPPSTLVEPPLTLDADSFASWNLAVTVLPPEGATCPNARLVLVEQGEQDEEDIVLQVVGGGLPICETSGVRVDVLRDAVGAIVVEALPVANGLANVAYFDSREDDAEPIAVLENVPVTVGEPIMLGDALDLTPAIQRVEITSDGGLQLTQLILFRRDT